MNLFLLFAAYFGGLAVLILVTAVSLYAIAMVSRKLTMSNADHASRALVASLQRESFERLAIAQTESLERTAAAQRERTERMINSLADKAHSGYEAEIDAIYYTPESAPLLRQPAAEPQEQQASGPTAREA